MKRTRVIVAVGAPIAAAMALAAPATAGAAKVSFRVEGASKTLLAAKQVTVPTKGSITKGGTPKGTCPAAGTAAGAFNVATRGKWGGTYSSGLGVNVTKILGESAIYGKGRWWEFFVNNREAQLGICDQKVKAGQQLLFASVPAKGKSEYPIVLKAPSKAKAGKPFTVHASYYPTTKGKAKPLAGVALKGVKGKTNGKGVVTVTATKSGRLSLVGTKRGEIRSAATVVRIGK